MLFSNTRSAGSIDQDIMMRLQELAGDAAGKGTICHGETEGTRPDWESWIVASTKRRTLFASSLFDNLVNFSQGSPSFVAVELAGLPAPAGKNLWNARTRQSWNQAYNLQLGHLGDGELLISDLWPQSEANSEVLQPKIDRWLSSVDEFGMMLYAVTAHTYKQNSLRT
ncbi:putative C6 finger domain protein [Cladophialophora carrionii]|uniref:Putative C6 finger domain protein n=1 Tax=Cladophialophora carrionii TaxID=86049 RepID=A0A1C1CNK1_9EURO|nr:putative C6 finger domain protein [Cladophialophora carrionii]